MDQDRALVEFLRTSKQRIAEFVEKNQSDQKLEKLLERTKEISKFIDSLIEFVEPCFSESSQFSIKKYEDCVFINRNVNCENEIASLLQQIQDESSDFLSFLENLQVVFSSIHLINPNSANSKPVAGSRLVSKTNILSLHKENRSLSSELERVKDKILKNESKLDELDKAKEKCVNELKRCAEVLSTFSQPELDSSQIDKRLSLYEHLNEYNSSFYLNT
ncbi:conserved hypothetical protein [Theileria orientalis strain Shintoku]|uniref:Uncharacterized protein n=1 Tax=Theileria orientalis strain Shintoku TaxID=869250 RepID=J4CD62_THEOR|nr:conserved hypothetical protein [Theileria orientalis strain Shintoku]PVC53371.1 hypothetical protein MACL_00000110 [Theileria orientalis]BAM40587.1 conserved hypothetical protein [Theileria orientalis strain Shintoku]|eukprot:XP_009690888.1 conserved hypothetical protein [Theileria orientalis strain Shintoku]